jgi:DNA excision repair protein ERCC-4
MEFYLQIFSELFDHDGLLVLGKGLGMRKVLVKFTKLYCSPRNLVFILNANDIAPALLEALRAEGVLPQHLPKIIDNHVLSSEREHLYKKGGCFLVTSRILILDFLNKRVPSELVSGFLVHNAHKVTETSNDAFILRIYRQENDKGFVKAFTDEAGALVAGFHKVEKIMKHLTVRKLYLWPRFQATVSDSLSVCPPEVVELGTQKRHFDLPNAYLPVTSIPQHNR